MTDLYRDKNQERAVWRENSIVEYAYLVKHIAARLAMRLPSSVFFDDFLNNKTSFCIRCTS